MVVDFCPQEMVLNQQYSYCHELKNKLDGFLYCDTSYQYWYSITTGGAA